MLVVPSDLTFFPVLKTTGLNVAILICFNSYYYKSISQPFLGSWKYFPKISQRNMFQIRRFKLKIWSILTKKANWLKIEPTRFTVYLAVYQPFLSAVWTGLEPATPCVTGRYSNQLNYHTVCKSFPDSECKGKHIFQIAKYFVPFFENISAAFPLHPLLPFTSTTGRTSGRTRAERARRSGDGQSSGFRRGR